MWRICRPTGHWLKAYRSRQHRLEPTYDGFERDTDRPPPGYRVDRRLFYLGAGDAVFEAARKALLAWEMMPSGWVEQFPSTAQIARGSTVVIVVRALGVWWPNACRVVRIADQTEPLRRFGFDCVTLPGHVESGQEQFMVTQDEQGGVWYQIYAHSRPNYWPATLLLPLTRRLQCKFGRDSYQQLQRRVSETTRRTMASSVAPSEPIESASSQTAAVGMMRY